MRVSELIEHLRMFGDDTQVFIATTPDDLAQPVTRKAISLIPATHTERYGLEQPKVLLTAYFPNKDTVK